MDSRTTTIALYAFGAAALTTSLFKLKTRLTLSRAKHRSLGGHARLSRRLAALIPSYAYDEARFFRCDDPPDEIAAARQAGFLRLGKLFDERFPESSRLTASVKDAISDLQFTDTYRVPFQFRRGVQQHFRSASFMQSSAGVTLTDLDGNTFYDLTGSYGVNLLGNDFYKGCIARAVERAGDLGPVLGSYHPVVPDNVERLRRLSGLDEVSFHMSGTEAVMQAVRLARYHTRRTHLVRFCGAYHGWWGDVQPGIGNPLPARETYTLKDMSEEALHVLRSRRDIACVLVNALQALHPNANPPSDSALVDSARSAHFDRDAYAQWLTQLRAVCDQNGIVLIVDDIFLGFRIARGGTQEYFSVRADMVTYGKTLGGGLPVGVLCGRKDLMKRFRDERPLDVCFARGTFNAHPYVMTAMNAFLQHFDTPAAHALYSGLDAVWNARADRLNQRLQDKGLPIQVANLSSIWTVIYTQPSRYNWMLQFYLRAEGLALSWIGSGRLIFSLNYTDADFAAVAERFVAAAGAMRRDGFWWHDGAATNKSIRRQVLREILTHRFGRS